MLFLSFLVSSVLSQFSCDPRYVGCDGGPEFEGCTPLMSQWTPGCFHNDEMVPVPGCSPNQNSYGCHGYIPPAETVASSSGCPSVYYNPQCTPGLPGCPSQAVSPDCYNNLPYNQYNQCQMMRPGESSQLLPPWCMGQSLQSDNMQWNQATLHTLTSPSIALLYLVWLLFPLL